MRLRNTAVVLHDKTGKRVPTALEQTRSLPYLNFTMIPTQCAFNNAISPKYIRNNELQPRILAVYVILVCIAYHVT
jgi:hypothetical protein